MHCAFCISQLQVCRQIPVDSSLSASGWTREQFIGENFSSSRRHMPASGGRPYFRFEFIASTSQSPADRIYSVAELSVVRLIRFLRVERRLTTSSHVAVAVAESSALMMRCFSYDSICRAEVAVQIASPYHPHRNRSHAGMCILLQQILRGCQRHRVGRQNVQSPT